MVDRAMAATMSTTAAPTPKFPVHRKYFEQRGPALTGKQRAAYCATAKARVDAVVRAERDFVLRHRRQVNSSQWKLLKKKKGVRIFRRRDSAGEGSTPALLAVGRVDGTLEDLIYGTYDKSTEEMKTTVSFPVKKACYMCVRRDGLFSTLKVCNICGVTACEKCRVRRDIFVGANHAVCEVACCQSCIFDAQSLHVRPAEPAFSLHASTNNHLPAAARPARTVSSATPSSTASRCRPPTSRSHRFNSVSASTSGDEHGGSVSDDEQFSRMNERDFEKIIEEMIDERSNRAGHGSSRAGSHPLDSAPPSASTASAPPGRYAAPPPAARTTKEEQAAMFQKMVELQRAASQIFKLTKANEEIMRKM
ncbi:hypothetical protein PybrP1_005303 [[Pythium] brassicae (nom. inval.)]|nr:hypothetical protein PybrP1_005303 [[Pythium] brassicae (nom. inval.)]